MNRILFVIVGLFGASSLLLADSAVKGAALLLLAAGAAVFLRRDSAATRHLVWLLAIVALLVVPLLSALLPEWRVLPEWASVSSQPVVADASTPSIARAAPGPVELPVEGERPPATAYQPVVEGTDAPPTSAAPAISPNSNVSSWNWTNALPFVWAVGFSILILRLTAARWLLWNAQRRGTVLLSSHDPLVTDLEAARLQLGIRRPVTLLIHPDKTIPVVWGVLQSRLLLPAAARHWSGEQLGSVLLHELAHVKRRDALAQLLTQFACALHWFNPLVWFAAWRLGVERERACDDLVLASGVRPSAYAGHLLGVIANLSAVRWRQGCGLAMARKSSLEGRLVAVLSAKLNRRGVSATLAAVALVMAVGIAVPIAMLRAANEKSKPAGTDMKPKEGVKLNADTEKRLQWGKPVNGLRTALAIRHASGKPKAGDLPDLYLVVQNVSDAPIHFSDAIAAPKRRELYIKIDGKIVAGIGSPEPTGADVTLQPREVAYLLMFTSDGKNKDRPTSGSLIAEGAIKDVHQTLVAEMLIEKAPAGAWTGKLVTGETTGLAAEGEPEPKDKKAQALFNLWRHDARGNGNIPGGLVGRLGDKVKEFIRNNTGDKSGDPYAKKMAPLVARFDASHDWTPAEAAALLDDIAAVTPIPLETALEEGLGRTIRTGLPLPKDLANAPWSAMQPNGLRVAWLLEPRAAEYRLGTPLKSRILFHNAGKNIVVFPMRTWYQVGHMAHDAKGAEIKVDSTEWLTLWRLVPIRLAPGEFIEVTGAGIGVGANKNDEDWQGARVGSWVEAKAGEDVTVTTAPIPTAEGIGTPPKDAPSWWLDFVTARLARESPLPADAAERTHLLDRVVRDLFGAAPTAEETAAFLADREPNALDSLAKRLAKRPGVMPFVGSLTSGPTTFRVLPADPDAAKKPRTANNPGRYTLGENVRLVVSRHLLGQRIVNEASIQFFSPDPTKPAPGKPYPLKLPDGYDTWAAAWARGTTVLWLMEKEAIRRYDFTNPAQVKETTFAESASLDKVPKPIRDALRAALRTPKPATEKPN